MIAKVASACAAGVALLDQGNSAAARAHFAEALEAAPHALDVRLLVAYALARATQSDEGRAVLAATPDIERLAAVEARRLADAALALRADDVARRAITVALREAPHDITLNATLAAIADRLDDDEAADRHLARALALDPRHIPALITRARRHAAADDWSRAVHTLDDAVRVDPHHALARYQRGLVLLTLGRFAEGWRDTEARRALPWHRQAMPQALPAWDGTPSPRGPVLVWGEQGLGDQVQFARFLPALAERATGGLIVRVAAALIELVQRLVPDAKVAALDVPAPRAVAHLPLMSAPCVLALDDEWQFGRAPYLRLGTTLAPAPLAGRRPRIGICWAGNPGHAHDRARSLPLDALRTLVRDVDASWLSLQAGAADTARAADPELGARIETGAARASTFADTARLIASLDRVVTADTAVAHVAAALGVPTTILVPPLPDWRWQRARIDSPWYASALLARRARAESWPAVLARVARTLPGYRASVVASAA
ncbi:MAG: tetratricopeptide repeat protein [Gemmatimonadaceae bacterium]|jgi:tetratricopeptide (TPR) repeat protein|nr:tetratricopeptide repeat protein [Gemmatimonadaceae bacterium]